MAVQIQLRRDTTQNWLEINPVLAEGEIGIEFLTDGTNKIKIGDGVKNYVNLDYFNGKISYNDLEDKPSINGVVLNNKDTSLAVLGIQPAGYYADAEKTQENLDKKANAENVYTKQEVENKFDDLLKIPSVIEDNKYLNNKFLKVVEGVIQWSDLDEDIVTTEEFQNTISAKIDAKDGYSLISNEDLNNLHQLKNYDDTEVKTDLDKLEKQISNKADKSELSNYISETDLTNILDGNGTDKPGYALNTSVNNKVNRSELDAYVSKTDLDTTLTNYALISTVNEKADKTDVKESLDKKQDNLTAGYGISIEDNIVTNTIPNVRSDWDAIDGESAILNKPELKKVATSGSYNDLEDKPYIPTDYELPVASEKKLGGIKVGNGLSVSEDGTLTFNQKIKDYNELLNKPSIGGHILIAGQTAEDLDLATADATRSALNLKADTKWVEEELSKFVTKDDENTDLDKKADKATTLDGYGITDAYTKQEVDDKIGTVYKFKGSVTSKDTLPTANVEIGDVWNSIADGANYAWTGTEWDKLSETIDLSNYAQKEDLNVYAKKTDLESLATKESVSTLDTTLNGKIDTLQQSHDILSEDVANVKRDYATKEELDEYAQIHNDSDIVVTSSQWSEDTTYAEYPWKADIVLQDEESGVDSEDFVMVVFGLEEANSGNFAPINESFDGYVRIWAKQKPEKDITIKSIIVM